MKRAAFVLVALLALVACAPCDAPKRADCHDEASIQCLPLFTGTLWTMNCQPVTTTRCAVDSCASRKEPRE